MSISYDDYLAVQRRILLEGKWTEEAIDAHLERNGDDWPGVKILWGLTYTLQAFEELAANHGECECDHCTDMEKFRGAIGLFADVFKAGLSFASHEAFSTLMAEKLGEVPIEAD